MSAIIGAALEGSGDCFGFVSPNPDSKAILHFDTEQSRHDHFDLVSRSVKERAGLLEIPEHFHSYTILTLDISTRLSAIKEEMSRASIAHHGLHLVMIDGVADIVRDPNDAEECFAIVAELHALADSYQCLAVLILHENPNSENGKTRGHLGSQLDRKAQTPIVFEKGADEVVSMYARPSRSCHWPKTEAVYFQFSEGQRMHISVSDPTTRRNAIKTEVKKKELHELAERVVRGVMSHSDLAAAIVKETNLGETSAKSRIKDMIKEKIITRNDQGEYHLSCDGEMPCAGGN